MICISGAVKLWPLGSHQIEEEEEEEEEKEEEEEEEESIGG
jgi:ribosomal protein L12E/L44/L45/RPP1/RPP2